MPFKKPINGNNIQLTIDLEYQSILAEELLIRQLETKAISATGIILNPPFEVTNESWYKNACFFRFWYFWDSRYFFMTKSVPHKFKSWPIVGIYNIKETKTYNKELNFYYFR